MTAKNQWPWPEQEETSKRINNWKRNNVWIGERQGVLYIDANKHVVRDLMKRSALRTCNQSQKQIKKLRMMKLAMIRWNFYWASIQVS